MNDVQNMIGLPFIRTASDPWKRVNTSTKVPGVIFGGVLNNRCYWVTADKGSLFIESNEWPEGVVVRYSASGFVIDEIPPSAPLCVIGDVLLAAQLFLTWQRVFD